MVLAPFRSFWLAFDRFSSFLTLLNTVRIYYTYKLRLLHELRDTNLSYLSKDKNDMKKFVLNFALKLLINIFCFDEEAKGVCTPLRGNHFKKRINDENRIHLNVGL